VENVINNCEQHGIPFENQVVTPQPKNYSAMRGYHLIHLFIYYINRLYNVRILLGPPAHIACKRVWQVLIITLKVDVTTIQVRTMVT